MGTETASCLGWRGGLYLLAFGMLPGIALQVAAAWTLVVEAGQHTHEKQHTRVPGMVTAPGRRAEPPSAGQLAAGEDRSRGDPRQ